ncbi:MAG: Ig-like domain-containing protein [Natronospirillum sp.]|uniref:Ig-like domain-containing protein n=1 Tax=Natronospirillum sp. TaxID=2812955 RepID=UPI0025EFB876|nr:Ig-like domain-containing protein [Natronospirillum sp.]MCH8551178.1 Ig-like domain-containing protein [Natronospirillum sp.]
MQQQWRWVVSLGLCLALTACSGSSGSDSSDSSGSEDKETDAQPEPFAITELTPALGEADIVPSMVMVARFNQAVDPLTLEGAFQLKDENGNPVEGSLEWLPDQKQAHFHPARALALGAQYELSWSDSVQDESGAPLDNPQQADFKVREGHWHDWETLVGPYQLIDMPTDFSYLVTRVGPQGDVLIGWFQRDDEQSALMASHYRPGDGWRYPQALSTPWIMRADALSLTWLNDQQAIAVWHEGHGGSHQVKAASFHYQTGWEEPVHLGLGSRAQEPRVIVRPDGAPVVHWLYQDQVHVTALEDGEWEHPIQFGTGQDSLIDAYELLLTDGGTRILVWETTVSSLKQVYQAVLMDDNSLQDPVRVVEDTEDVQLVAAFTEGDDWLVVWSVDEGSPFGRRPDGQWFRGQEPLAAPFWIGSNSGVSGRLDRDAVAFFVSPEGYRDLYLNSNRSRARTDQQGELVRRDTIHLPNGDNNYALAQWVQGADGLPIGIWRYDPWNNDNPHSVLVARHSDSLNLPLQEELLEYELSGPSPRVPDLYYFTGTQGHSGLLEFGIIDDLKARIRTRVFD